MENKPTKLKPSRGKNLNSFESNPLNYKQLFELSPNAIMVYGDNGLLDHNLATRKLFGMSPEDDFKGKYLEDFLPEIQPNGRAIKHIFKDLVRDVNENSSASLECLCMKMNTDEVFPVEAIMSLLEFPDEKVYQITLYDLSDNSHWQDALQVKKEIIEVSRNANTCIITASAEGLITYLNEAACRITGWVLSDAVGQFVSTVIPMVDDNLVTIDVCRCELGESLKLEKYFPEGAMLISKDGIKIMIRGLVTPQIFDDQKHNGCIICFSETTLAVAVESDELRWHATHDPLTRLPNRVLLADRFKQALFSATRHDALLAVCMIDLDEFKPINDQYGHAMGDLLLIEVANRIRQHLRQNDTVARLGGDEFVILIGDVKNKPSLVQAIQRLRSAVAEPYSIEGKNLSISCSIGVTLYPEDKVDSDTLLRHADQAMFIAKQLGRNRVHWFDIEKDQQVSSSQKLVSRIEQALVDNEFELYYQPKVNMRTGDTVGVEALIRWNHPEEGLILPLDFLPFIEQNDLIIEIGEWVLSTALTQLVEWQRLGFNWSVSVNIAAKHFHVSSFSLRIKHLLREFPQVKPGKLEIEILESVALGDIEHVQKVITECQSLGVRFALDDFGTGYSSLSYLKRLPANVLKIDQSFIRDILDDQEDLALVQAISSLAVTFEREIVAEGVETVEHGALLLRLGCDVAQGYGIARPMPARKVAIWDSSFESYPLWKTWSKSKWDLKAFPLLVAQYDVREWSAKVISRIEDGTLPQEEAVLTDSSRCRFGLWYKGYGVQEFGELDTFKEIDPIHLQVHRLGDEIIQIYADGQFETAKKACLTFHQVEKEMFRLLDKLQAEVFLN